MALLYAHNVGDNYSDRWISLLSGLSLQHFRNVYLPFTGPFLIFVSPFEVLEYFQELMMEKKATTMSFYKAVLMTKLCLLYTG